MKKSSILWQSTTDSAGEYHSFDDNPALVYRYLSSRSVAGVARFAWYQHGKLHRDDGPAVVQYSPSGAKIREAYMRNGKYITDQPAIIYYTASGEVRDMRYANANGEGILDKTDSMIIHYTKKVLGE